MDPNSKRWTTVSDSEHDHEREALAWMRSRLPDSDPLRVWSNFQFVAGSGALYEVDALVLSSAGLFLVEFKAYPGEIAGDAGTWQWTAPGRRPVLRDNPRELANKKAKAFRHMLGSQKQFRGGKARLPWVQELIFLSDPDLKVMLGPAGRFNVCGRDPDKGETVPPQRAKLPGIVETVLGQADSSRQRRPVDRPLGRAVADAVAAIGIRERTSRRTVGDYRLGELLDDVESDPGSGIAYQDFAATHVAARDVSARIRVYPLEHNATGEEREAAERAAIREFEHLRRLDHPGILRPTNFTESDRGPALVFDMDSGARPLHHWLAEAEQVSPLSDVERIVLVRLIAEAVRAAHGRGVTHRLLSPAAVLVSGDPDDPRVKVRNWHAGALVSGTRHSALTATRHVEALGTDDAALYRAPESNVEGASPIRLDVFSLGAIAALVFTGRPPAKTDSAYLTMLLETGFIDAASLGDGLRPELADIVEMATAADPAERLESVQQLVEFLDTVQLELEGPEVQESPEPRLIGPGTSLADGRFGVAGRLGAGASALVFEVLDHDHDDRVAVLKVAKDPEHNHRIEAEAGALAQLRHHRIVEMFEGPIRLGDHLAILMEHAGSTTLAERLADQPGAELAERFGSDLLEAVCHLEEMGVSHRDIKPDNIGVVRRGADQELRAVLYDFSLAGADIDQIQAGTQGYLDPFLAGPSRGSFDLHAERFAAAVTLFELTSGSRPRYGDGTASPLMIDDGPSVDASMFESSAAAGLVEFFETALARDVADRFGTAADMLRAWHRAFEAAALPAIPTTHPEAPSPPAVGSPGSVSAGRSRPRFVLPAEFDAHDSIAVLGLSRRAVNAMERAKVLTVTDLAAFPVGRLPRVPGVGAKTRSEITAAIAALRRFEATGGSEPEPLAGPAAGSETGAGAEAAAGSETGAEAAAGSETGAEAAAGAGATAGAGAAADPPAQPAEADSLVAMADTLTPPESRKNHETRTRMHQLLLAYPPVEGDSPEPGWPTQTELAPVLGVTRGRVSQLVGDARARWSENPAVNEVADWVGAELASNGGALVADALAEALASARPDGRSGVSRRAAVALVRAAVIAEWARSVEAGGPRWAIRRNDGSVLVVASADAVEPDAPAQPNAEDVADYGAALARAVEAELAERDVLEPGVLLPVLRGVAAPALTEPWSDTKLADTAVRLCGVAEVNARLEVYRRGLDAKTAVSFCRRSLVADATSEHSDPLTREAVGVLVRSRFPAAAPIPSGPDLDALFDDLQIDLRWDDETGEYRPPDAVGTGTSLSLTYTELAGEAAAPPSPDEAAEFQRRTEQGVDSGGLRVFSTSPRKLADAVARFSELDVTVIDFEAALLRRVAAIAASGSGPSWAAVMKADAEGPGGARWGNLMKLVDRVLDEITGELAATEGTVLIHGVGLLGRYDRVELVARWRDLVHAGGSLAGVWLLTTGTDAAPTIDEFAVPVVSAGEWATIPNEWLIGARSTTRVDGQRDAS